MNKTKTKLIGILVLLSIMLSAIPMVSAATNDVSITSSLYPYVFAARGMTPSQAVTFNIDVCNRGTAPQYGIDIWIKDISAGMYVMYQKDVFSLSPWQCQRFTSRIPIDKLPSVWGPKYWSGITSKYYFYTVEVRQDNYAADENQNNNFRTHTIYVRSPYSW